ncbi:MAG: hypothetical protein V8R91_20290 [Butyricimonas faecihominis]
MKRIRGTYTSLTSSLSYFQTFQKHEVNAIAGIEINSRKIDSEAQTNYRYSWERGHKFTGRWFLENYSEYRNTVAENYPAITDTKDDKFSFYGAFTYTFDNRYSFNFNIRADGYDQIRERHFHPIPTDMVHLRKMERPRIYSFKM